MRRLSRPSSVTARRASSVAAGSQRLSIRTREPLLSAAASHEAEPARRQLGKRQGKELSRLRERTEYRIRKPTQAPVLPPPPHHHTAPRFSPRSSKLTLPFRPPPHRSDQLSDPNKSPTRDKRKDEDRKGEARRATGERTGRGRRRRRRCRRRCS